MPFFLPSLLQLDLIGSTPSLFAGWPNDRRYFSAAGGGGKMRALFPSPIYWSVKERSAGIFLRFESLSITLSFPSEKTLLVSHGGASPLTIGLLIC